MITPARDIFWLLLLLCMWMHVLDDFVLQKACLCELKQRDWWQKLIGHEFKATKYAQDYIMALVMHAISWSVSIALPLILYSLYTGMALDCLFFWTACCVNAVIHAFVDDMKANRLMLNLVDDQAIHIVQIVVTVFIYVHRTLI